MKILYISRLQIESSPMLRSEKNWDLKEKTTTHAIFAYGK